MVEDKIRETIAELKKLDTLYPDRAPFLFVLFSDGSCGIIDKNYKGFKELKVFEV